MVENFLQVLRDHTAGDPMRADVTWTNLSRRQISRRELLILCDGGGSNSSSQDLFKEDLQALSNRLKLKIRIAHYPPDCSKYNPIEHRVLPHVTRACKGVPLETIETAKHYMEKTETTTSLNVVVRIIDKVYETGRKYAEDFKEMMTIKFDKHLPKWNYTANPDTT